MHAASNGLILDNSGLVILTKLIEVLSHTLAPQKLLKLLKGTHPRVNTRQRAHLYLLLVEKPPNIVLTHLLSEFQCNSGGRVDPKLAVVFWSFMRYILD